jgi:transposase
VADSPDRKAARPLPTLGGVEPHIRLREAQHDLVRAQQAGRASNRTTAASSDELRAAVEKVKTAQDALKEATGLTAAEVNKQFKDITDATRNMSDNMITLIRKGMDPALVAELAKEGPLHVAKFARLSKKEIASLSANFRAAKNAEKRAQQIVADAMAGDIEPQRRALEQNPAAVRRWLTQDYPAICAQARREGGVVLWLDEMGVRSDAAAGRSWAPVGQTPVVKRTGKRFRVNMVSAISNAGRLRFRLFTGSFTGAVFIDFLGRLLRDCGGRRVHLIVDGHPVHRAKLVSAWVGRHAEPIELHFLPGYSPELNPVELLNQDVKANAAGRRRARSAAELTEQLRSYLRRRQRQPEVVARFFRHPRTCYAAQ